MLRSLFKFLLVGLVNSAVGISVIFLAKWVGGMGDISANVLGYSTALAVSFTLNREWTFHHTGPSGPAVARFAAVIGLAYVLNLATVLWAIEGLQLDTYLSQALGIIPYTLFTFTGLRYYAFR